MKSSEKCPHDFGWENASMQNIFVEGDVAKIGWENRDPARVKMVCNRNCGAYRYVYLERPKVVKYGPIKKGLKIVPKFKLTILDRNGVPFIPNEGTYDI